MGESAPATYRFPGINEMIYTVRMRVSDKESIVPDSNLPNILIMTEQNKKAVLAYVDAFNRGDIDGLCALFTPDALIYGPLGWGCIDKAKAVWQAKMHSFTMTLQVESIIAEDDVVAARYIERGKSMHPYRTEPELCESYEVVAMEWFEIRNGFIHRRWCARDSASIYKKMGLTMN